MKPRSQQNSSKSRKTSPAISALNKEIGGYHEQLDRLREYVAALSLEKEKLEQTVAQKTKELVELDEKYRKKHMGWLDVLANHQAQVEILHNRITRLEKEETQLNEIVITKRQQATKEGKQPFLPLT